MLLATGSLTLSSFPKQQILDFPKFKESADDIIKFDEKGRKFSKRVETLWENEK